MRLHLQRHLLLLLAHLGARFDFGESLYAVARFPGTCLRLAAYPREFPSVDVFDAFGLGVEVVDALLLLLKIIAVVAFVVEERVFGYLEYVGADSVQEVTVVGDHEQRHFAVVQEVLEPFHHFYVEVVGRLVENQQFRLGYQHVG